VQKQLVISIPSDSTSQINFDPLISFLEETEVDYKIIKSFREKKIQSGLYHKEFDIVIMPLHKIPVKLLDGICIAAVTGRESQEQYLVINPEKIDISNLRAINSDAIFGHDSLMIQSQFSALFPHAQHKVLRIGEVKKITSLEDSNYSGVVLDGSSKLLNRLKDNHPLKKLAVNEIVPPPGAGVVGYICRMDDIQTRSVLKNIHVSAVSEKTNIERKVMSRFENTDLVACYVHKDNRGNFHGYAAFEKPDKKLYKTTVSQSTTYRLADEIINKLNNL